MVAKMGHVGKRNLNEKFKQKEKESTKEERKGEIVKRRGKKQRK